MKKIFKLGFFISLLVFVFAINIYAYDLDKDDKLYVSGAPIGIKLDTGVTIAGTYGIAYKGEIYKPWDNAKITEGDIITKYGDKTIKNISDLELALKEYKGIEAIIEIVRNKKSVTSKITPLSTEGGYSLGLYVKDNIIGVGTLTYYIKDANIFGSLGHKITDYSLDSGEIYEATITDIVKARDNAAGQKEAAINNRAIGFIKKNTITGVHGNSSSLDVSKMEYLGFKTQDEINCGKAQIWTCISGDKIEKYDIDIISLENQKKKDIKGITFRVIDKKLIDLCGGIVQGMSGSPIVQDNKIIGAVTHVSVSDAKLAYGIYLEWMLEDMDVKIK